MDYKSIVLQKEVFFLEILKRMSSEAWGVMLEYSLINRVENK